jgi:tRNA pseudouridine55 synthase
VATTTPAAGRMAQADTPLDGVLPVDKPVGPTSHDVVVSARRALGTRRIGHTGTLDPFASGLLLLCIGRATRIAEYISGLDKRYTALVRLGIATDTDDLTGSVTATRDPAGVSRAALEEALTAQRGPVLQRPPTYSAKKLGGERAYALARQGRDIELEPVPVEIRELRVTRFELPDVELEIECSSGTYIRAIARDLGDALGVGAHLVALRRTRVGGHHVESALTLDRLDDPAVVRAALIQPLDALAAMPRVDVGPDDAVSIRHGRALRAADVSVGPGGAAGTGNAPVRVALAADGDLLAIAEADGQWLRPKKVFL